MEEKSYYSIKDISEFVEESPSTLRYWETEFDELKPKRGLKGRRKYTPADLETIRIIKYLLRTKGMHISIAKQQLKSNHKNLSTRSQALTELTNVKEGLELLLQSLSKTRN